MKIFNKASIAAALLVATLGAGSANAFTLESLPDVGSSNVNVVIKGGVATIYGNTNDYLERENAERYVQNLENVDKVINLITFQ